MAELVVPPLVRARLAACALPPGAGEVPRYQVRSVTGATRRRLLGWLGHLFGTQLRGHLGVREQYRFTATAALCNRPERAPTHPRHRPRRGAPRMGIVYMVKWVFWPEKGVSYGSVDPCGRPLRGR